jgi:hypothetical protein
MATDQAPPGSWPEGIKLVDTDHITVPTFKEEAKQLYQETRDT